MRKAPWDALGVQTFGLPPDLHVPIAAKDPQALADYVGMIECSLSGRKRPTNAVVVVVPQPARSPAVPLWREAAADEYYDRLHPTRQLWVHVDYTNYRNAWKRLGFGELTRDTFLDHVQNRAAIRIGGYHKPFVRLCPVSRGTNTSAGLNSGAEGMERTTQRGMKDQHANIQRAVEHARAAPIRLADPVDITKMLDIPPGLSELQGVASMISKYYATDG